MGMLCISPVTAEQLLLCLSKEPEFKIKRVMWHIWIETGKTVGMFSKSVGFYSHVHLGKRPSKGCAIQSPSEKPGMWIDGSPVTIKVGQSDFCTARNSMRPPIGAKGRASSPAVGRDSLWCLTKQSKSGVEKSLWCSSFNEEISMSEKKPPLIWHPRSLSTVTSCFCHS